MQALMGSSGESRGIAGTSRRSSLAELVSAFGWLGLTSFGGPIAHLGYFRREFVDRRKWLDEPGFAEVVGLCQFLPGPTSSQVAYSIGLMRAGLPGAVASWAAFTLPSLLLMAAFALGAVELRAAPLGVGAIHGLKLVAVAIVAQAVLSMARSLTPDLSRAFIAVMAALVVLAAPPSIGQVVAIGLGAALGLGLRPGEQTTAEPWRGLAVGGGVAAVSLVLAAALFAIGGVGPTPPWAQVFHAFYRSGALVFGGGHVVLPLLQDAVVAPGWVSQDAFLAGYGAAQALPGPLFSLAGYLGAIANIGPRGMPGAALAMAAISLPGLLLVTGLVPHWGRLRADARVHCAMRGVNAAVVGLLATALYSPVWTSAVHTALDLVIVLAAFVLLVAGRCPPILAVLLCAAAGALAAVQGLFPLA
jgi:chromate transporter